MRKKAIFVTGATGFLGSYVVRYLLKDGYKNIYCLRRTDSNTILLGEAVESVQWIEGDILDTYLLHEIMKDIDVVIHVAAVVSFDPKDTELIMKVNVEGTANMINASLEAGVKRFVYISSISALGRKTDQIEVDESNEWTEDKLNSIYAFSKYNGELEVKRGEREGLSTIILNPSVILGSGFWNVGSGKIFKNVYQGLRFYPRGGTGFVDVRDVAQSVLLALENDFGDERFIISGANQTWLEVLSAVAQGLDKSVPKIALTPELALLGSWGSWLMARMSGQRQMVSRSSLMTSSRTYKYDNRKSIKVLCLQYRPLSETLDETCAQLMESASENFTPKHLSLS